MSGYIISGIAVALILLVVSLVSLKPDVSESALEVDSESSGFLSSGFLSNVFDFIRNIFGGETETGYEVDFPVVPPPEWDEPYEYIGLDVGDECEGDLDCKICLRCDYAPDDPWQEQKVCIPSPSRDEAEHPVKAICDFRVSDSYCSTDNTNIMRKIITTYCDGAGGCTKKVEKEKEIRNCMFAFPKLSNQCNIKGCSNGKCVVNPYKFRGMECNDFATGKKGKCVVKRRFWYDSSTDYVGVYGECHSDAEYLIRIYFYLNERITIEEFHKGYYKKSKEVKRILKKLGEFGINTKRLELAMVNERVLIVHITLTLEDMTYFQEYLDEIGKNEIEIITSYLSPATKIRG